MPHSSAKTTEAPTLPPINVLFAEVLQRQLVQPATPPVRRPSAWPGFPGPDKDALLSGYAPGTPPPPLQVGRRSSVSSTLDVLRSPSIFPTVHAWETRGHSTSSHNPRRLSQPITSVATERDWPNPKSHGQPQQPGPSRTKRQSWSDSAVPRLKPVKDFDIESGSRTPADSPRLDDRARPPSRPRDASCHCAIDQQIEDGRAAAIARGTLYSESRYANKQQIPTPLPPAHGHIMIPFQPTPGAYPGRSFGVCMADILDFRPCLLDPDVPVLDNGVEPVFLTLEAKGYATFVQTIPGNCPHRRMSRFNLAYAVALAFQAFLRASLSLLFSSIITLRVQDFPFNPAGLKAAAIVVRSIDELRLVNLYSRDGGKVWRVHVAYC
ncbi:hypothetical protein GGX14DRAFT_433530, partial [Mycena pura]